MRLTRALATSVLGLGLTLSLVAHAKLSKVDAATAGFQAKGPAGMNIDGSTGDVSIADDGTTVTVSVQLANLTTGMGLRDKHTKEALEVGKFASVDLSVPRASLTFPKAGDRSSGDTKGTLKLHGVSKEVTFHYDASADSAGVIDVNGAAKLSMSDFGIEPPSYLGVSVKPDVKITVHFKATDG